MATGENSGLKIGINTEGKIVLYAAGTGLDEDLISPEPVNDSIWHFIAIQRDSVTYRLYVDDSAPIATGEGTIQKFNKLTLGAKNNNTENFEGTIDEVKLYDWAIEERSFKRNYQLENQITLKYIYSRMRVRLEWIDQSNEAAGFFIDRKIGNGDWEIVGEVNSGVLHYIESLDLYDTTYYYRVRSASRFTNSGTSNVVSFLTPNDPNTGIAEQISESPLTFPNPTRGVVRFSGLVMNYNDIDVFNLNGVLLKSQKINNTDAQINISNLNPGVYIVRVNGFSQRVVLIQ